MKLREIPSVKRLMEELYPEDGKRREPTPFDMSSVCLIVGYAIAVEQENEELRARLGRPTRSEM